MRTAAVLVVLALGLTEIAEAQPSKMAELATKAAQGKLTPAAVRQALHEPGATMNEHERRAALATEYLAMFYFKLLGGLAVLAIIVNMCTSQKEQVAPTNQSKLAKGDGKKTK